MLISDEEKGGGGVEVEGGGGIIGPKDVEKCTPLGQVKTYDQHVTSSKKKERNVTSV